MLLHLTCTNGHGAAAYLPAAMLQGGVVPDLLPELLKPENGVLGALSDLMPLCLPATASTQQGECSSTGGANSAGMDWFSRHGLSSAGTHVEAAASWDFKEDRRPLLFKCLDACFRKNRCMRGKML